MNDDGFISFDGIDPAVLVHALYHGTRPLGMGYMQNQNGLSVDQVREELQRCESRNGHLYFDYFFGRPLKMDIDLERKRFSHRLYDRDAGRGAAQAIVDGLRGKAA